MIVTQHRDEQYLQTHIIITVDDIEAAAGRYTPEELKWSLINVLAMYGFTVKTDMPVQQRRLEGILEGIVVDDKTAQ